MFIQTGYKFSFPTGQPLYPCDYIRKDFLVGMSQVGRAIGIINRSSQVKFLHNPFST
jgi:hypothetical protein